MTMAISYLIYFAAAVAAVIAMMASSAFIVAVVHLAREKSADGEARGDTFWTGR